MEALAKFLYGKKNWLALNTIYLDLKESGHLLFLSQAGHLLFLSQAAKSNQISENRFFEKILGQGIFPPSLWQTTDLERQIDMDAVLPGCQAMLASRIGKLKRRKTP